MNDMMNTVGPMHWGMGLIGILILVLLHPRHRGIAEIFVHTKG
jgi:hypothetical protein